MKQQTYILRPGNTQPYQQFLTDLAQRDPEKEYKITFGLYKGKHSAEQQGYYWGVVIPTIQAFIRESRGDDYSCDDIHEWYRDQFLPKRVVTIKGIEKVVRPSTSKLSVAEYSEYLELVIHHCAENGIYIPPPVHGEDYVGNH